MIESISIKDVASYDNEGVVINDLKKINFIYGANASGKTTISNFIYDNSDAKFSACSLNWQNGLPMDVLVYNKGFRERNFGKGKLSGIFTLGEATTEQIKEIEEKREELKKTKAEGIQKSETLKKIKVDKEALENDFRETTWVKIYKKYEDNFKEAFTGVQTKEKFKNKILEESKTNIVDLQTLDILRDKAKTIFDQQPEEIQPIVQISFDKILEIESNGIWEKIIVGKADVDIAKLIQRLNINDWVNQGRDYIQENICPFCQQQTITADFKTQLEKFFDETYLKDIETLKELKQEYTSLIQNIINQLNVIETNQKALSSSKLEIDKFSAYLKTLISQSSENAGYLLNKAKEPSRSIELVSLKEQLELISKLIDTANLEIKKHNDIIANYNNEKSNLIKEVWRYLTEEHKADIDKFIKKKNGLEKGVENLEKQLQIKRDEYRNTDVRIKELSKNVTSIQPTIDEINKLLKSFGFFSFSIVPATENGFYQIQREDGTNAETTLSEGEITFITFLYYLQLTKGGLTEDEVNNERVLIIDDPISSLDSNILFIVSTLIKEIIKNVKDNIGTIKQIILLTHNVYFHKEVSFIDGRKKNCDNTNFWILRKNDRHTSLQNFGSDNPIQSSYELLWQELRSEETKTNITVQNIMRRIIEFYFKLLGKYGDDDLIRKFNTKEEQEICRSLICWINDGSHSINDDLFIELQDRTVENYNKVFREIFLYTDNIGHYNMMMRIND